MNENRTKKLILVPIFFLALFSSLSSIAQNNLSEYNWLFGNSQEAIIFNKSDAQPQIDTIQSIPFGTGGSGVISDPLTGDILFYTDGNNVYDIDHQLVPNGAGLLADPSINNAVAISPFPFSDGRYYIFTNPGASGSNEIEFSIADRNLPGNASIAGQPPQGDISVLNQPTGLTNPSDGMIVLEGVMGSNTYWLITNDRISFEYKVLEITNGVFGAIQTFDLSTPSVPGFVASSFSYNADSSLLAVAPKDQGRNIVLLDFDPATGVLSLNSQILNSGNLDFPTESIYGLEWSSNGTKLYISRHGSAAGIDGNLYQYALEDTLNNLNSILFGPVYRSYGLKRGPDQNIYHLYELTNGSGIEIGRINEADSLYSADSLFFNVGYDSLFFGNIGIQGTQFPSFSPPNFEMFNLVDFNFLDSCAETTTKFFPNVDPTPERYFWDFGDGNFSNAEVPVYAYQTAGNYTVTLNVVLNGIVGTAMKNITILQNDLMVDLGIDTVICAGETLTLDAGTGGSSYAWNTKEFSQTIEIDTTGTYWVAVVSAATGCVGYDAIQVTTYGDQTQIGNQWYFGEMAGIDFNETPPVAITDANLMNSPAAASSISDANGDLLFYTNGVSVWNNEHRVMINGNDIGGDSTSAQGAMIVPLPSDPTIFYIFTTDKVWDDFSYNMKYSVVDIKKDTARGEVIVKDLPLFQNSTERMTASGFGGNTSWLVTHEYGNNNFRSFPITQNGIQSNVTSAIGSVHRFSEERNGTANMKFSASTNLIAVALQDSTENFVEIFGFNNTTGYINNYIPINIQEPVPSLAYGVSFSSSDLKLYVTTNNNGSKLLQYDLDSLNAPTAIEDINGTKFEMATDPGQFGDLQAGPDQVLYIAIDNSTALGTISNPNGDDINASFNLSGFDLAGRISRLGLPNFGQNLSNPPTPPGISATNLCFGQPTVFDGTGTSIIDTFFWTFGNGFSAAVEDTTHTYTSPGTYTVTLRIQNRCGLDSLLAQAVDIFSIPTSPQVPGAVTVCNAPVTLSAWPVDSVGLFYTWSTGETTRSIVVDQRSIVDVFITDSNGCSSDIEQVLVDDTRPVVSLGPDRTVCENISITDFDALNPGSVYQWGVNNTNTGNNQRTQTVDTSVPGIFVYDITVTDIFACIGQDSVVVTVNPNPNYSLGDSPTSGCGNNDGQIALTLTDNGSFTYQLSGASIIGTTPITGPNSVNIGSLAAGNYQVNVTNTLTGCSEILTEVINDGGSNFNITSATPQPDCGSDGDIEVIIGGNGGNPIPAPVNFIVRDNLGNILRNQTANPGPSFIINDLPPDVYSIEVIDNSVAPVCVQTINNITLTENAAAEFSAPPQDICGIQGNLSIVPITNDPSIVYTWTGPSAGSIVGSNSGQTIIAQEPGTYSITAAGGVFCPRTITLTVTQSQDPNIQISVLGDECDGALTLAPFITNGAVGNLGYLWDDGSQSSQRIVNSTGTYSVTVLDQGTGCSNSANIAVDVFNDIDVFLTSDPNCDNNSEVFLSAISNITEDVTFEWTDPTNSILSNTSAEIAVQLSGDYTVRVSGVSNSCVDSASINVLLIPILPEELLLPESALFCSEDPDITNTSVTLDPGFFSLYEWRLKNDDIILSTERQYTISDQGVYEVTLSNGLTCLRDEVNVRDDCAPRIEAPTAFTPGASPGLNDDFFVFPNIYVENFEIFIFSRQGELVYHSDDINFRWNGIYRGDLLQIGTYAYVMRFSSTLSPERGIIEQHGGVVLLK